MASNKGQKIFIWVIAVTMLVGTFGTYFLMILANDNSAKEQKAQQEQLEKMQEEQKKQMAEEQKKLGPMKGYSADTFDARSVTKLEIKDLKKGTGKEVKEDSKLTVSYFGWLSNGKIFDSTMKEGKNTPAEFGLDQTVEGWIKGLTGAKVGTIRQLTIPAEQAYGSEATPLIPANSPLRFIVEIHKVK
jgi:FKBP-type peptidyl-prolyl cis-trans isomerase